jgi:hypothetical protein
MIVPLNAVCLGLPECEIRQRVTAISLSFQCAIEDLKTHSAIVLDMMVGRRPVQ